MKYECIQEFQVDKFDEDGNFTGRTTTIKKGSKWEIGDNHIIDGEIHLDNTDESQWLEISKERLESYFKEVVE